MPLSRRSVFKHVTIGGAALVGASRLAPTRDATAQTGDADDLVLVCTEDNVRVRSKPSLSAKIRGTVDTGDHVSVTGVSVEADDYRWVPISVHGTKLTGWSVVDHFERPNGELGWLPGTVVHVNTDRVNLHSGAGINYPIAGNFNTGTQAVVNGGPENGDGYAWYNITIDHITGWMADDYLTEGPASPTEVPAVMTSAAITPTALTTSSLAASDTPPVPGLVPISNGDAVEWGRPAMFDISRAPYNADLSGNTDETATIQALLNDADAAEFGAIFYHPRGRLRFSDTLIWPRGVRFQGGYGAGANPVGYPSLVWAGPSDKNMIEVPDLGGTSNLNWMRMERIALIPADGGYLARNGIVFKTRTDQGTDLRQFRVAGCRGYGIVHEKGGINAHYRDFRIDTCGEGAFYWNSAGVSDIVTLSQFTTDNLGRAGQGDPWVGLSGRVFVWVGNATSQLHFTASHAKVETNGNLPSTNALGKAVDAANFEFHVDPANTSKTSVYAHFDNIWVQKGGSASKYDGIRFYPASDLQSVVLTQSQMTVKGIPTFTNTIAGEFHASTVIAPMSPSSGITSPASRWQATELVGDTNLIGSLNHHGKKAAPISSINPGADLPGVTLQVGDMIMDPSTRSSGHRIVREVTGFAGTLGTLAGVTATGTSGASTAVVSDISQLKIGQAISIAGQNKVIRLIDGSTNTITVQSKWSSSFSNAAVGWVNPTYRQGQFIPVVGSKTWNPPSVATGAVTSTTVTAPGATLGDFAEASFSLALPAGCFLRAEVTAANTVTVSLVNLSGASQDVASGTVRVRVFSQ